MTTNSNIIEDLCAIKCIKYGDFTLKSGIKSNYYVDVKSCFSSPKIVKSLCNLIYQKLLLVLKENNISLEKIAICGLPYAGIPFASYISILHNIPLVLLRKEVKQYGTKKIYEGNLDNTTHLFLIDDIFTTGTSINESLSIFNKTNPDITIHTIVIIDRSDDLPNSELCKYNNDKIRYSSLFKLKEITEKLNLCS